MLLCFILLYPDVLMSELGLTKKFGQLKFYCISKIIVNDTLVSAVVHVVCGVCPRNTFNAAIEYRLTI